MPCVLLDQVGNRIGGRLLVSFAKTATANPDTQSPAASASQANPIIAYAVLNGRDGEIDELPENVDYLQLGL